MRAFATNQVEAQVRTSRFQATQATLRSTELVTCAEIQPLGCDPSVPRTSGFLPFIRKKKKKVQAFATNLDEALIHISRSQANQRHKVNRVCDLPCWNLITRSGPENRLVTTPTKITVVNESMYSHRQHQNIAAGYTTFFQLS